ncbi:MAG TPA: Nif3-like dinuclear metal center hexameric protein [Clostridia bacterium]|nr:Nif3-like dinuclear metal center hexameric protein [Clostridia bacterium]
MNTTDIMNLALEMSGFRHIPDDSEIYVSGSSIKKALFGIDINNSDVYMAKTLGYDAVIAHHPLACSTRAFNVFKDNIGIMMRAGIPEEAAKKAVAEKYDSLRITAASNNYDNVVSVAKLLGMPLMNIHQPLDEIGRKLMQDDVDAVTGKNPEATLSDIVEGLYHIPEFTRARTKIDILLGEGSSKAGKTLVSHGAYTNGGYDIANTCFEAGINTIIYIHIAYPDYIRLKREKKGNLIVTGHIASDCAGINPFISRLRAAGIEITGINGII